MSSRVLVAAIWLLSSSHAFATIKLVDRQPYSCGPFIVYNSPWSTSFGTGLLLKQGTNYIDIATIFETCPNETVFEWYWPGTKPKNAGVYGYDAVSWGQYDGGTPETPITPRSLASLSAWSIDYSLDYRSSGEWNQLSETFLRDETGAKRIEIGFVTHVPATTAAWIKADPQLGIFNDRFGRAWTAVRHVGPTGTFAYVTLSPPDNANRASGALDFLGAARWLQAKGLVNGAWMAQGLAVGIEPISGSGALYMHRLVVTYR
jgi:hypothetical protein